MLALVQVLGTGCSGLLVVLKEPPSTHHELVRFKSPISTTLLLGKHRSCYPNPDAPGGVAQLRENAPEGGPWHSLAHVLGIPNPTTHGLQGI